MNKYNNQRYFKKLYICCSFYIATIDRMISKELIGKAIVVTEMRRGGGGSFFSGS
jgi:hypothetical protein